MKNLTTVMLRFFAFGLLIMGLNSCGLADGNKPGHEYMPDMAHGIAFEANYYDYYGLNTWGGKKAYHAMAEPRLPVAGTIPFGASGLATASGDRAETIKGILRNIPENGHVDYNYGDTEEERTRAMAEITQNPFPITDKALANGKEMFTLYCAICHGDKGTGDGYLIRDGSPYPAQPANLTNEEFTAASAGRFYHAMMYGKNVMGGYYDKLSYEERWDVLHYIRSLQASAAGAEYSASVNTLNGEARPGKVSVAPANETSEE